MSNKQTITINGRQYDAHSGLAVQDSASTVTPVTPVSKPVNHAVAAGHVHASTQRSQTLNRRTIKKPVSKKVTTTNSLHTVVLRKQLVTHHATVKTTSPHIAKFAPHPTTIPTVGKRVMDFGPVTHPHVAKAHAISKVKADPPLAHSQPVHPSAHTIKQTAISNAIANTSKQTELPKKPLLKRHPRAFSIVTASLAIVILGGYLTYLNMPSLSVRVAAAQAGINANYPNYQPDGYSLNGLIGYTQGQVSMKFASNGGPQNFTIKQTKSGWDSEAVLDNYVTPRAGVSYIPYTERGLTIYTYGNNAAWVNGGILYTIEGDAPLSSEQIRHIATSLI
jgi:hypothetical protein